MCVLVRLCSSSHPNAQHLNANSNLFPSKVMNKKMRVLSRPLLFTKTPKTNNTSSARNNYPSRWREAHQSQDPILDQRLTPRCRWTVSNLGGSGVQPNNTARFVCSSLKLPSFLFCLDTPVSRSMPELSLQKVSDPVHQVNPTQAPLAHIPKNLCFEANFMGDQFRQWSLPLSMCISSLSLFSLVLQSFQPGSAHPPCECLFHSISKASIRPPAFCWIFLSSLRMGLLGRSPSSLSLLVLPLSSVRGQH